MYDARLKSESDAVKNVNVKQLLYAHTGNERLLNEFGLKIVHRVTLFYTIIKSLTQPYLRHICNLVPHNTGTHNL